MAQAILATTKLRIVFQVGLGEDGKPLLKAKTFSNIQRLASANQLLQAAQAVTNLSNDTLSSIERVDNSELLA